MVEHMYIYNNHIIILYYMRIILHSYSVYKRLPVYCIATKLGILILCIWWEDHTNPSFGDNNIHWVELLSAG